MTTSITSNATSSTSTSSLSSAIGSSATLSQSDFLTLLTTQLKYQDPTKPVDNTQFVSEMAQFSQLSATNNINSTVSALSSNLQTSQALSSTSLVGQYVMAPSSSLTYTSGTPAVGAIDMNGAGTVNVAIKDSSGNTVASVPVTATSSGLAEFKWDGTDSSGQALASGTYTMSAMSGTTALSTYAAGQVVSVNPSTSSGSSTSLNVQGVGEVALAKISRIY